MNHPARFGRSNSDGTVDCLLCPQHCHIADGKRGVCGARANEKGVLDSLNYELVSAVALDPIEKKPLYHYYPGKMILSIGTVGCNLRCQFCQNHHLSRYYDDGEFLQLNRMTPAQVVSAVKDSDSVGVAYTYSEPSIWAEYVIDVSKLMRDAGLKNIWVTNGYIEKEPLEEILPLMDAANIDLKAFSDENYKSLGGRLQPVLDTIRRCHEYGTHIELTTLVIPDYNDNMVELESLVKWIASVDKSIPFHISRYFPHYHFEKPSTDVDLLGEVFNLAKEHLEYVYIGNVLADSNSYCPVCGNLLVKRMGFSTHVTGLKNEGGQTFCGQCGTAAKFIL
ncbi:MAG: AmmeMemoRadiSam system radical SAM enzyme [Spirochaetes bacterium GWF1_49_6]|nr:MAG: AmmeMemoRadiSam system radical SAM enzyme [Spirochaetes bacterium GWF1_49_6]